MSGEGRWGVLPIDKPVGPTSHDVVAAARRSLGVRRIGHTGTLDPFASGLLLLCVGRATRLAEFLTGLDKTYEATARLGVATDTEDVQGDPVSVSDAWRTLGRDDVEGALTAFLGTGLQTPPRYSAKKVGGVPAHRRVRRGEDVELEPREVTIHEVRLLAYEPPTVRFAVRCSSGTYVRSLARDVGERLRVGAHLTALRRTAIGDRTVDGALPLDALDDAGRRDGAWIEPLGALAHLPRLEVDTSSAARIRTGSRVATVLADLPTVLATHGSRLVAVGAVRDGAFLPRKVLDA